MTLDAARGLLSVVLLAAMGCVSTSAPESVGHAAPDDAGPSLFADGAPLGEPDGSIECYPATPPVPCCLDDGGAVGEAECNDGGWACAEGSLCKCGSSLEDFFCTDFCGSDSFQFPDCVGGSWQCDALPVESTSCPLDTCWGDGSFEGDCCDTSGSLAGLACQDGALACPEGLAICACPVTNDGGVYLGIPACCDTMTATPSNPTCVNGAWTCASGTTIEPLCCDENVLDFSSQCTNVGWTCSPSSSPVSTCGVNGGM